jgi:hypothetical protein
MNRLTPVCVAQIHGRRIEGGQFQGRFPGHRRLPVARKEALKRNNPIKVALAGPVET